MDQHVENIIVEVKRLFRLGQFAQVKEHLLDGLQQYKNNIELSFWLAQFYIQTRNFTDLVEQCDAVKGNEKIRPLFINALRALKRHAEAIDLLTDINLQAEQQLLLAMLYKESGQFLLANQILDSLISRSPNHAHAYWQKSMMKGGMNDNQLNSLLALAQSESLPPSELALCRYALATHFDNQQQYESAFGYYQSGAQAKKQSFQHYDPNSELQELLDIEMAFERPVEVATPNVNAASSPIFIVGMPRTGTTLVEQILASHSDITGADELTDLAMATQGVLQTVRPKNRYPFWADELSSGDYAEIAKQYLLLTQPFHNTTYFTDKMPLNFKAIGIIMRAFPNAKIIHCQRNGLDTIWGNFRQLFGEGIRFSYDLNHLSHYYLAYKRLMEHWLTLYPQNILTVDYEEMVNNFNPSVEKLFEFLSMEVQPSCYAFHNTVRVVHTLSNEQVRQPLNRASIERWRSYEFALTEVKSILNKER